MKNDLLNLIENIVKEAFINIKEDDAPQQQTQQNSKYGTMMRLLNDPLTNEAEIMRKLWNPTPEDEDAKRSLFSKKKRGALNDDGVPYRFDDEEVQRIIDILSKKGG